MPKVTVILLIYNASRFIKPVFDSIFRQTHKNLEVVAVINGSNDGSKEMILNGYPKVRVVDPGKNLWFAAGNNLIMRESKSEFIFLVNQDIVLEDDYVEMALRGFADPKVAAVTGKLLRYDFSRMEKTNVIDSTGIVISKSGRARDRGQGQVDAGQYDKDRDVFGVTGACPIYRKSALDQVAIHRHGQVEYFDEDFVAYWEDVDLSWRLNNAGFKNYYVPEAVGYHGRTAAQAPGGYLKLFHFIKHHNKLPLEIKKLNYKNHILMYLKNSSFIHPAFIMREIAMFFYISIFETRTLAVVPELIRQIKNRAR